MNTMPPESVLRWVADVVGVGANVVVVKSLHGGFSPWLLRIEHSGSTREVVLRVAGSRGIRPRQIAIGAAALRFAERHGLAAPRLIASDLDGQAAGAVATLETAVPGSSSMPPTVSAERLRAAGAMIARVHAIPLTPQPDLPLKIRSTHADDRVEDRAMERRWAALYQATPDSEKPAVVDALCELTGWPADRAREVMSRTRFSPLLQLADELLSGIPRPQCEMVFVHGDIWAGNMLWSGDTCVALIDWKDSGVGDPGVDLGNLRMKMAIQYGPDAPAHMLDGWQRESGRHATNLAYWDAVAAAYSPAILDDYEPGFDDQGHEVDWLAKTRRRDAFLREALDQLYANGTLRSFAAPL
jgi:aminoglycoside phosphotransferase (APT) family kinase protein